MRSVNRSLRSTLLKATVDSRGSAPKRLQAGGKTSPLGVDDPEPSGRPPDHPGPINTPSESLRRGLRKKRQAGNRKAREPWPELSVEGVTNV